MPASPLTPRSTHGAFDSCDVVSKCAAKRGGCAGVTSPTRRLDRRGGPAPLPGSRHRRMRTPVRCHMQLVHCVPQDHNRVTLV